MEGAWVCEMLPPCFLLHCSETHKPSHQVHPQSFWEMQMPGPHTSLGRQNLCCLAEKSSTRNLDGHQREDLWSLHNQDLAQGLPWALSIHSSFLSSVQQTPSYVLTATLSKTYFFLSIYHVQLKSSLRNRSSSCPTLQGQKPPLFTFVPSILV